jgi:hypothetical protein
MHKNYPTSENYKFNKGILTTPNQTITYIPRDDAGNSTSQILKINQKTITQIQNPDILICNDCKKTIPQIVADHSMKRFGDHLCYDCQLKYQKKYNMMYGLKSKMYNKFCPICGRSVNKYYVIARDKVKVHLDCKNKKPTMMMVIP